jgi:hypothetical protein
MECWQHVCRLQVLHFAGREGSVSGAALHRRTHDRVQFFTCDCACIEAQLKLLMPAAVLRVCVSCILV